VAEADRAKFRFFPNAVAAIDSTPIRVLDHPKVRYLRKALWSGKHSIPAWKLTVAVAPNGICIWRCFLDPGRRNDKRSFDESDASEAFLYVAHVSENRFQQCRFAVIMGRGYQGVQKYWPDAIIRFRGAEPDHIEFNLCVDSDRAIVECFFGILKKQWRVLGDEGCRRSSQRLEDIVTLCIALTNATRRIRGFAPETRSSGFVRGVPVPFPHGDLPRGRQSPGPAGRSYTAPI
jgi:hypothetical protein